VRALVDRLFWPRADQPLFGGPHLEGESQSGEHRPEDAYRQAYIRRLFGAGLSGAVLVAVMTTIWPDWPLWIHSIGAFIIWSATTYLVLRFWPLPDRPTT
jgi:hypothetical protein